MNIHHVRNGGIFSGYGFSCWEDFDGFGATKTSKKKCWDLQERFYGWGEE